MNTARIPSSDPGQPENEENGENTVERTDMEENSGCDSEPVLAKPPERHEMAHGDQRISKLSEMQQAVFRVLRFAVSQTNLKIDQTLIKETVTVLHKSPETFTEEEEERLWTNYNTLSMLVFPATNESIRIAEQIDEDQRNRNEQGVAAKRVPAAQECGKQLRRVMFCLVGILVFFIVLQSYVILLTDVLRGIEQHTTELNAISQQINDLETIKPDLDEDDPIFIEQDEKRNNLDAKLIANFAMLARLSVPWHSLYTNSKKFEASETKDNLFQRIALEQAAKSILQVLNYYLLPLVLGLLGAVAFIVRSLLNRLSTTSYTLNSGRRHAMRLALGALLGVISGIFLAPEQTDLQPFNLSLVVLAFLMGYSVEFAFSIFDALIERGRKAVLSGDTQPGSQAKNDSTALQRFS